MSKRQNILKLLVVPFLAMGMLTILGGSGSAATQSVVVPTTAASDNPHINNDITSPDIRSTGVMTPGSNTAASTPLDDASSMGGSPNGYTWRFDLSGICSGAQLQTLRVVTSTITDTTPEPTSGVFLGVYGSEDLTMLNTYTINGGLGEDSNTWVQSLFSFEAAVIDRGTSGTVGPTTTFPADAGLAGQLDATWSLTGLDSGDTLGLYVQHWLAGNTTAQTAIQSVELTYDDAGCIGELTDAEVESTDVPSEQLAESGQASTQMFITALALLSLGSVTLVHKPKT